MQCNPLGRRDLPNLAERVYLGTNLHIGFTSQLVTVWWGVGGVCLSINGESWVLVFWFKLGLSSCSPVGLILGCSPVSFPCLGGYWNPAVRTAGWCHWDVVLCSELKPSLQHSLGRRVSVEGREYTGTPFSVHTCGLAFKTGSSSRTELGCLLEFTAGAQTLQVRRLQSFGLSRSFWVLVTYMKIPLKY